MSLPEQAAAQDQRYHGLDAARAIALLLGITLHAACSFIPGYRAWAITDVSAGPAPAAIVFTIHMFRMHVFFLMAGFFARLVCRRKGLDYFWRDRLRRILVPLVLGWIALYPFLMAAWIRGAQVSHAPWLAPQLGSMPVWKIVLYSIATGDAFQRFSLGHLWFLYYLLLLYALTLGLRLLLVHDTLKTGADRTMSVLVRRWWGLAILAIPPAIALQLARTPAGLLNPEGLVPAPAALCVYGSFFAAGWMLHRQPDLLAVFSNRWRACTVLAALITGLLIWMINVPPAQIPDWLASSASYGYALGTWLWVVAFVGACLRFLSHPSSLWRYASDASYWVYLAHLPLIVLLQVAIAGWHAHWLLKIALLHVIAIPPLLASYHYLVRPTIIGTILNGKRVRTPLRWGPKALPESPA